ncbi:hypothetical protein ACS0TY_016600 [Phlomoides rotata]
MNDLPVGFRFCPNEEELVSFYLLNKLNGTRSSDIDAVIPVVNIYDYNPWDLPPLAGERCPADTEQWFFFTPRQESEARGGRINRLTERGYWKATGSPGDVYSSKNHRIIGRKKTMVFYEGRAPKGAKTNWKMNEFKVFDSEHESPFSADANHQVKGELSVCRIYQKTKCMKGFDRRLPAEARAAAVHHHNSTQAAAVTIRQNNNPAAMQEIITTSSTVDSSSSGDVIINNPSPMESDLNTLDFAIDDNQPLWDWEDIYTTWFADTHEI